MFERLDFSNFYSTNTAEREGFCRQLVSSLKQFGFARLANIGIPPSDIDGAFETVEQPRVHRNAKRTLTARYLESRVFPAAFGPETEVSPPSHSNPPPRLQCIRH
ncbi:hypothetical protein J3E68DRAFT_376859 [Trichoderma sp. SZMC 28012]